MRRFDFLIGTTGLHLAGFGLALLTGALLTCALPGHAQEAPKVPSGIYSCVDKHGNRLTRDRPIVECSDRDQRILNPDGSLRSIHPPSLTADERAEREAKERKQREELAAIQDAGRRDLGLMKRYPSEALHLRAREAALDTVRQAIRATEQRLRELAAERRPLQNEAEFYQGRPLPPKLKQQIEANDTATEAQRSATANQTAELNRVTRQYDAELERLRKLWAGAKAGSMGPLVVPSGPAAPVAVAQPAASTPRKPTSN